MNSEFCDFPDLENPSLLVFPRFRPYAGQELQLSKPFYTEFSRAEAGDDAGSLSSPGVYG